VQENPTMVEEDLNPSYVFFVDVDEPHSFVDALNVLKEFTTLEKGHGF
jgi:hypothetical protein